MSDEAKRRREARRARILANSEDRMSRIHGVTATRTQCSDMASTAKPDSRATTTTTHTTTSTEQSLSSKLTEAEQSDRPSTKRAVAPGNKARGSSDAVIRRTPPDCVPSASSEEAMKVCGSAKDSKASRKSEKVLEKGNEGAGSSKTQSRASLKEKPSLMKELGAVVGLGDLVAATLGVIIAILTVAKVGTERVYEEHATGTLNSGLPIILPFVIQEVGINGAGLELGKNPLTIIYGAFGLGRRLCIYLFCFLTTLEMAANQFA